MSIEKSLSNLISFLEPNTYNIFISIGHDSRLADLSFYNDMRGNIDNKYPTIIIFFTRITDFGDEIREKFDNHNDFFIYQNKKIKNNINIFVIPFYLPLEEDQELTQILSYMLSSKFSHTILENKIQINYRNESKQFSKINLDKYILSFFEKEFMKILTSFCISNIRNGGKIVLLNRFFYNSNTRVDWNTIQEIPVRIDSNLFLEKIPYFYPFISLLNNEGKKYTNTLSIFLERKTENILGKIINTINNVSNPPFFSQNFNDKKEFKPFLSPPQNQNSAIHMSSLTLNRQLLTGISSSNIIEIPNDSFSTARGNRWLDSYAVIIGINNILNKFPITGSFKKVVVGIPEIQYELINGNWSDIKRNNIELLRDCHLLFIPINTAGNHWTLLLIDFQNQKSFHFDSLQKNKDKKNKDKKPLNITKVKDSNKKSLSHQNENYQIANQISNKILDINSVNIEINDQQNDYDCGAFILLHLQILIDGYLRGINDFKDYLIMEVQNKNLEVEIKNIREEIYMLGDNTNIQYSDNKKDKNKDSDKNCKEKIKDKKFNHFSSGKTKKNKNSIKNIKKNKKSIKIK